VAKSEQWRTRISIDPTVHHGEACIAGTRVSVSVIVGSVADGDSVDAILGSYPQLTRDDVEAALRYAAEAVRGYRAHPVKRAS
jgi:uncharacterized protein (DUF433 family)